jgi:hypothetical protein
MLRKVRDTIVYLFNGRFDTFALYKRNYVKLSSFLKPIPSLVASQAGLAGPRILIIVNGSYLSQCPSILYRFRQTYAGYVVVCK